MANSNRDFYIKQSTCLQVLETYKSMEQVLRQERQELLKNTDRVSGDWEGTSAQTTRHMMKTMLMGGIYAQSYDEVSAMRICLEETLPRISTLLERSQGFTDQFRNDDYVEPVVLTEGDNRIRNGGILSMDYGQINCIKKDCNDIIEYTDIVVQSLIDVVEDCGYLLDGIDECLERIQAASRKLHRIENYWKSFEIFVNGIKDLESYMNEQMRAITGDEGGSYGEAVHTNEISDENVNFSGEQLVTTQQMDAYGFVITEEELEKLNRLLKENGITDIGSIALFIATCAHESNMGKDLLEKGTDEYFRQHGYTYKTRGAGYIQITGQDQIRFYKEYLKIDVPDNPAKDIAENYAWEASVWEWACQVKGQGVIMNDYVTKYGYKEGIFLVTQYFINSYLSKDKYPYFDSDLRSIRKGEVDFKYNWEREVLCVNGREYRLPKNYADRLEKYKEAIKCFIGENYENSK